MSLQDDYFDLAGSLDRKDLEKLERIWGEFCAQETQLIRLEKIASGYNSALEQVLPLQLYLLGMRTPEIQSKLEDQGYKV